MVAKVVVDNAAYSFDIPFSYQVPPVMQGTIAPGCRVMVPFGRANRLRQGLVLSLEEDGEQQKLKAVSRLVDREPLLNPEQLWLAQYLHDHVFCTYYDAVKAMIPSGLTLKVRVMCSLGESIPEEENLTAVQKQMLRLIRSQKNPVPLEKLLDGMGITGQEEDFRRLVKEKIILLSEEVREKSTDSREIIVHLREDWEKYGSDSKIQMTAARKRILDILQENENVSMKELCYYAGTTRQTVDKLESTGLISYTGRQIFRSPYADRDWGDSEETTLDPTQQAALDKLQELYHSRTEGKVPQALLYGVTGSGKSQVYLKLAEYVRQEGGGVIILVPEISLTPQTVELFQKRFGKKVAVLHSGLTMAERADEYKRIRQGLADVVVGTRSAVFAPLQQVSLIVMDEEQEGAYASQSAPRYHARDIARARCRWHQGMFLMASATPSIETYYQAQKGRIDLITLEKRYCGNQLPEVQIVDMNHSYGFDISSELTAELSENLKAGHQSIVLLNRRGYHTTIRCNNCGEVLKCPNCSVALTYHQANNRLMCHYCGYSRPLERECPSCHSNLISYTGSGTQKIQEELQRIFPQADILRMDMDTTMSHMAHEKLFGEFAAGKYHIMVGTQLVAKGLNFPNVTLVGVLNSDQSIYSQDFRGCEKAFSLLTQVVGRCGRGEFPGRAMIQTLSPDHPVIRQAAKQDYKSFYEDEISTRKLALYPPFCTLCQVGFSGEDEGRVKNSALLFAQKFRKKASCEYSDLPIRMMNPCEPVIARVSGKYRYQLIIKCRMSQRFSQLMWEMFRDFDSEKQNRGVRIWADLNGNE